MRRNGGEKFIEQIFYTDDKEDGGEIGEFRTGEFSNARASSDDESVEYSVVIYIEWAPIRYMRKRNMLT